MICIIDKVYDYRIMNSEDYANACEEAARKRCEDIINRDTELFKKLSELWLNQDHSQCCSINNNGMTQFSNQYQIIINIGRTREDMIEEITKKCEDLGYQYKLSNDRKKFTIYSNQAVHRVQKYEDYKINIIDIDEQPSTYIQFYEHQRTLLNNFKKDDSTKNDTLIKIQSDIIEIQSKLNDFGTTLAKQDEKLENISGTLQNIRDAIESANKILREESVIDKLRQFLGEKIKTITDSFSFIRDILSPI